MDKCRFAKGDRVILSHQHPERGFHGIPYAAFGTEFIIQQSFKDYDGRGAYYYIGDVKDYHWGVYDCMLEPVAPLSPFDVAVRAYIRRELPNGSG